MLIGAKYRFAVVAALIIGVSASVFAQSQRSFVASPDVYKVVAENDEYMIVEVTWKPGQRDQFHSHAKALSYWLTDCNVRFYMADGKSQDTTRTAGRAGAQTAVGSHSVENIGKSDCKVIMFEPKSVDDLE